MVIKFTLDVYTIQILLSEYYFLARILEIQKYIRYFIQIIHIYPSSVKKISKKSCQKIL